MEFRIANTFTESLSKLTNQEQKAVKTAAFDLQMNPAQPSLKFHKLDRLKDAQFWSVSVSRDLRLIVHKTDTSLLLCYVDHHDDAYGWARKRKIERHPRTGAAQIVEVRETVKEIDISPPKRDTGDQIKKPLLFSHVSDDDLLGYGVPTEWLEEVRQATEDTLFDIAEHLPQEAAEALLELATGGKPKMAKETPSEADPFSHPDAQRRFRVLTDVEELERALAYPWEKWTVFLHPAQRELVERPFNGPARISGSAGTGKTIVALHRAVFLARQHSQAKVLLTTFSHALADALAIKLDRLIGSDSEIAKRVWVRSIKDFGYELYEQKFGQPEIATPEMLRSLLVEVGEEIAPNRFTERFLWEEWTEVVDAWQIQSWEAYREVPRLGRKTRLGGKQREALWSIFDRVNQELKQRNLLTWARIFRRVEEALVESGEFPFDYAVVDEAQDLGIAELHFLASLGKQHPDSLFFTGDQGQRIFQQPFSWKALGVDIRGRSRTLNINYRTSHQIREKADRLLPLSLSDVDGNVEERKGTVSVFNGLPPQLEILSDPNQEIQTVGKWIKNCLDNGFYPYEIGVFVRETQQLERAKRAIEMAQTNYVELDHKIIPTSEYIAVSTMHLAKGMEFRAVAVMACDDEVIPLQERIETVADEADLEEVYRTERHLLYVACTRARDRLLVTGVDPASEFLEDIETL